jgi:hypothetical protein
MCLMSNLILALVIYMILPEDPVFGTWYYLRKKRKKNLGSTRYQIQGLPVYVYLLK